MARNNRDSTSGVKHFHCALQTVYRKQKQLMTKHATEMQNANINPSQFSPIITAIVKIGF